MRSSRSTLTFTAGAARDSRLEEGAPVATRPVSPRRLLRQLRASTTRPARSPRRRRDRRGPLVATVQSGHRPPLAITLEDLERLLDWIDEPGPCDALFAVDAEFLDSIDASRGRGKNLADPVGFESEEGRGRRNGHSFAPPARQVRNQDVAAEMEFGFVEDPPPARTAASLLEGREEFPGRFELARAWATAGRGETADRRR